MDRWDALFGAGLFLALAGIWLIYRPASMVIGGGAVCAIALRTAPTKGPAAGE